MRTAQKLVCSYRQEGLDLSLDFGSYVGGAEVFVGLVGGSHDVTVVGSSAKRMMLSAS